MNIHCFWNKKKLTFEQVFRHISERNKSSDYEVLRWDRNSKDRKEERVSGDLGKGEIQRLGDQITQRESLSQWTLQVFYPGSLDGWQCNRQKQD